MTKENSNQGANQGANQGEGNREAARVYNKDTTAFTHSGKAEKAARDAAKAVDGPEGESLRKAEETGRARSHGEDPQVKR